MPLNDRRVERLLRLQILIATPFLGAGLLYFTVVHSITARPAVFAICGLCAATLVAVLLRPVRLLTLSAAIFDFAGWAAATFLSFVYPQYWDLEVLLSYLSVLATLISLPMQIGGTLGVLSLAATWLPGIMNISHQRTISIPHYLLSAIALSLVLFIGVFLVIWHVRAGRSLTRELWRTQSALSASGRDFANYLGRSRDVLYQVDPSGRLTFINSVVTRYGYDPVEMIGNVFLDYVHPDDRGRAKYHVNERRTGERRTRDFEVRLLLPPEEHAAPENLTVSWQSTPVFLLESEGLYDNDVAPMQFLGSQGSAREITELKEAKEALRVSREKYAKMFRAAPAAIAITTLGEGRFLDVNEAAERMFGFSRDEIIGRTARELGIWSEESERDHFVGRLTEAGQATELELHIRDKSGLVRTVRGNAVSIVIDGRLCVISAAVDITEYRQLELHLQQSQKLDAIGRLAGGIAHDFNNMLAVILGEASLAAEDLPADHGVRQRIEGIRNAARRSAQLTRQLLTFARGHSGTPRSLNLNDEISERLPMLRRLIGEDVQIVWKPGPDIWTVVLDDSHLDQVLMNLAANARDAMADIGRITISTANHARADRQWVVVTIEDTGSGMSEETKAHLFEPFYTTKGDEKGTGLGLATVYGIVKRNGGWIDVESELGNGTKFTVWFPKSADDSPTGHDVSRSVDQTVDATVLVVEDEVAVLESVASTLRRRGYAVLTARSPAEALQIGNDHRGELHLLFTDVVMPGMHGSELYETLTARHPEARVIYMSGYANAAGRDDNPAAAGANYLQKPFSPESLFAKVAEILLPVKPRDAV